MITFIDLAGVVQFDVQPPSGYDEMPMCMPMCLLVKCIGPRWPMAITGRCSLRTEAPGAAAGTSAERALPGRFCYRCFCYSRPPAADSWPGWGLGARCWPLRQPSRPPQLGWCESRQAIAGVRARSPQSAMTGNPQLRDPGIYIVRKRHGGSAISLRQSGAHSFHHCGGNPRGKRRTSSGRWART